MAQPQQRPAEGVVRFYNFLPEGDSFLDDVLAGLARPQKTLPPKYFYDVRGCELFEQICTLPEYYPTRTELAIMREHAGAMAKFLGPDCQLIEFGSGSSTKTRILIEQLQPPLYVPIDIAGEAIRARRSRPRASVPLAQHQWRVRRLHQAVDAARVRRRADPEKSRVFSPARPSAISPRTKRSSSCNSPGAWSARAAPCSSAST